MNNKADTSASEEIGQFRSYHGLAAVLIKVLSVGFCIFGLLYLAGVFHYFRFYLWSIQYNAIFMAVVLTLTFLLVPAGKSKSLQKLSWYDVMLILGSLAGSIYIAVNARELTSYGKISASPLEVLLGTVVILALIDAVRRSFGWAMVAIILLFIMYAKFGYLIPGPLSVFYSDWSTVIADIYLSSQGVFGSLTSVASGIILAFIAFGVFFVAAGGGDFFLKLALATTGNMRGGPAKAAILGSAMFGTISGNPQANIVVTGSVTIPLMKQIGYKPYYAGAVETVASTGGMLTPPVMGGVAFIMADRLGIPYASLAMAAAIPALMYYTALYMQVHLQAIKLGLGTMDRKQLPSLVTALKEGWEFIIPFIILVLLLIVLRYQAVTAGLYTILVVLLISMFRQKHRINISKFIASLDRTMRSVLPVATIIALAGVITALLTVTGLGPKIGAGLITLFGGNVILLVLASGITCYVMGMGISLVASYILVSILVVPALATLGLMPLVVHFFIMYMVISSIFTPPYCPGAYVAATIAKAHPFRIGFQSMRLGIVTFIVPIIIVFNPALLLVGNPGEVVLAALSAILGILGLSAAVEGYLFSATNWVQRISLALGAILMIIPGLVTDGVGLVVLALIGLWQWTNYHRAKGRTDQRIGNTVKR